MTHIPLAKNVTINPQLTTVTVTRDDGTVTHFPAETRVQEILDSPHTPVYHEDPEPNLPLTMNLPLHTVVGTSDNPGAVYTAQYMYTDEPGVWTPANTHIVVRDAFEVKSALPLTNVVALSDAEHTELNTVCDNRIKVFDALDSYCAAGRFTTSADAHTIRMTRVDDGLLIAIPYTVELEDATVVVATGSVSSSGDSPANAFHAAITKAMKRHGYTEWTQGVFFNAPQWDTMLELSDLDDRLSKRIWELTAEGRRRVYDAVAGELTRAGIEYNPESYTV